MVDSLFWRDYGVFLNVPISANEFLSLGSSEFRINPAVGWIKPKSRKENGFRSNVYICSEGKELRYASSGNQIGGQFGPKQRGGDFHRNTQLFGWHCTCVQKYEHPDSVYDTPCILYQ